MKSIHKITLLFICLMTASISIHAQSKCKRDKNYGSEWTGEWDTKYGKLVLTQEGNKVTGTYKDVGTIEGYYNPLTGKLIGTFTNNGNKGRFEFTFTSCEAFVGKWGWGSKLDKGTWTGSRKESNNPKTPLSLKITLNGLRALQGGDGKGNPDDYSLNFTPNLRANGNAQTIHARVFNFRKSYHEKNTNGNVLFTSNSGQIHIEPDYPPTPRDRSKHRKKYAKIENSGRFKIFLDDYQKSRLRMNISLSLLENTKANILTRPEAPYWLAKNTTVPVNIQLVLDYLTKAKTSSQVKASLREFLGGKNVLDFDLFEVNGKRKAIGYIVVQTTEDNQTYKAGVEFTLELAN